MTRSYEWTCDARLPAGLYDVAANETWLEEQAAKGFIVSGTIGQRILFEKADPLCCRYRMQPFGKKGEKMEEERIELYRDLGWEYVDSVAGLYHLWRCDDPDAPELDTDPVVQGDGYRYLKRCMVRTAVVEFLILTGVLMICIFATMGGDTFLRNLLRDSVPLQFLAMTAAVCCMIFWEAMEVVTMRRLLRRLELGIPLERPKAYRKKSWVQHVMVGAYGLYIAFYVVNLFWPAGNGEILGWSAMDNGVPKTGMVYVDVTKLEAPDDEVDFDFAASKVHELAGQVTQVKMRQLHHERPGYNLVTANADTTYYDLRFSVLVPMLVEDIRYAYRNWEPFEKIETPYLDCFLITDYEDRGNVAIAAKGNTVIELFYSGETDLRTLDTYFAGLLTR